MQKKLLMGALAISCLGAFSVSADTVLGGYVGAQAWNMETTGGFASRDAVANFAFEDKTQGILFAALEHPIPLIPNIKLIRTGMDTNGLTQLSSEVSFGGELFTVDSSVSSDIQLTTTDIILYYEILDNELISLDVGINGKYIDGIAMLAELNGQRQATQDFSGIIPMIYSKIALGIPATGLGFYAEGSYVSYDDNSLSDFQAGITYSFVESLALDMSVQAGYRQTVLELDDLDDIYTDLEFSGVFVGLEFDF